MKISLVWIISAIFLISTAFQFYSDDKLHIYFLDIGQGDSILVRSPDRKYILIDGGPDDTVLSELNDTLPVFVKKIDLVILTHPDSDHITGLVEVLKYYNVEKVAFNPVDKSTNIYSEFVGTIEDKNIENIELRDDDDFKFGCCIDVDVLWPEKGDDLNKIQPVNNISIAIKLTYGDFEAILAGDLESASEAQITNHNDIDADLLKVNHHGSNTSSIEPFLREISPELAVIQVGANNKFGHPTGETLEKLKDIGAGVYRNDLNGKIEIQSDGFSWSVECEFTC